MVQEKAVEQIVDAVDVLKPEAKVAEEIDEPTEVEIFYLKFELYKGPSILQSL